MSQRAGEQEESIPTYGELRRLVQQLQAGAVNTARRLEENEKYLQDVISATRNEYKMVHQKLETCNAEKSQLLIQLGRLDVERMTLYHQVSVANRFFLETAPKAICLGSNVVHAGRLFGG